MSLVNGTGMAAESAWYSFSSPSVYDASWVQVGVPALRLFVMSTTNVPLRPLRRVSQLTVPLV